MTSQTTKVSRFATWMALENRTDVWASMVALGVAVIATLAVIVL